MQYKIDEVDGYIVGQDHVCPECITEDELSKIEANDILVEQDLEEAHTFCDRCSKLLD